MILRLTCPRCYEDSYSPSTESFRPCPYCGIVFSGKYGIDQRGENRIQNESPVTFSHKGQNFEANAYNFSNKGLRVSIEGEPSITDGDIVGLTIGDQSLNAQVIWVKKYTDKAKEMIKKSCCAGLKVLDE